MPPRMITLIESVRKWTAWWLARNFGYFAMIGLFEASSTCDSSAMTPDCCVSLKSD
jgi:hypothetical protein